MNSHVAWRDIRADHVERAGGEAAVDAGKRQMLAETVGHRAPVPSAPEPGYCRDRRPRHDHEQG